LQFAKWLAVIVLGGIAPKVIYLREANGSGFAPGDWLEFPG